MTKLSNKQEFKRHLDMITRFGGCNLVAEEISKMFNLPCYMVYHKYVDYDDTGTRKNEEITISEYNLNDFKNDYTAIKNDDHKMLYTSQPIGHCYFIDYLKKDHLKNKPVLCDGLETLGIIKNIKHPEAEIIDQFELDFPNYNFDPKNCIKLKPADFNLINRNDVNRYASNSWNDLFIKSMIRPMKRELKKYIEKKPWLNKQKIN